MPNKWTFKIKPIGELVDRYVGDGVGWIDPFAGMNSPAEITNDLNPEMTTDFHLDALDFLKTIPNKSKKGVVFDPPYSFYQLLKCYKGVGREQNKWGEHNAFWSKCKNEVKRILQPDGISLSFGWNSVGVGKTRGFKIIEILLVCHGSVRNDTICTVEVKR